MRALTFLLGSAAVLLAVWTACWFAEANRLRGRNERLEREIAQLVRERDTHRAAVERLRQPLAIRTRVQDLTRSGGRPRAPRTAAAPFVPAPGAGGAGPAKAVLSKQSHPRPSRVRSAAAPPVPSGAQRKEDA